MAAKENSTLRMEPELKEQAAALFRSLGMDLSTATRIFYIQALRCRGLPFEVKLDEPNETTRAALEEGDLLLRDPDAKRFTSVDELFEELKSQSCPCTAQGHTAICFEKAVCSNPTNNPPQKSTKHS